MNTKIYSLIQKPGEFVQGFLQKTIVVLLVLSVVSCGSWVDPNVNISPNSPTDVPIGLLLPGIQTSIAYVYGGDMCRYTSLYTQHHRGVDRQHLNIYNFSLTETDVNNAWNTMYAGNMNDIQQLISKADAQGLTAYRGVGRVLLALALGHVTDLWGDIPYSEAFKGISNSSPKYDSQESIYATINTLLDGAIVDLTNANPGSIVPTSTNDLMYAGNRTNWAKAARTLKARYAIHLSKLNGAKASADALAALAAGGLTANGEDLKFNFVASPSYANPLFQFMSQRGDIRMGNQLVDMMNKLSDPRMPFYMTAVSGKYTIESSPGTLYAQQASSVVLLPFTEAKFIEAEAQLIAGKKAEAKTAYTDAVRASLVRSGVAAADVTAYLAKPEVVPAGDITIQTIMEQKYIALYTMVESYTDWRRTGYPVIDHTKNLSGATASQVPRRWPRAQNERLNNLNFPGTIAITERLWWDKP